MLLQDLTQINQLILKGIIIQKIKRKAAFDLLNAAFDCGKIYVIFL
jgi:hypothetical protein